MPILNKYPATVKVWDPLVRVFHWGLVFFFLLAFASGDDWDSLHFLSGYAVALLLCFRLVWGIIGTRNARFLSFVKPPRVVINHLKAMLSFKPGHYLGHNPVAAVMVIALLISIALVSFSGMVLIATEGQGPLAGTLFMRWNAKWMEEVHEFFANFTLLLVFMHVAAVVFSSFLEGENLVRAMITGRKRTRAHWEDFDSEQGASQQLSARRDGTGFERGSRKTGD
jgi:cytochrome b